MIDLMRYCLGVFCKYSQLFYSCCFCCQGKLERVVAAAVGFAFVAVFVMLSTFALFRFAIVQFKHF